VDGSIRDARVRGHRVRLASLQRAVEEFPRFAFFLATGEIRVSSPDEARGAWLVTMTIPGGETSVVLAPDFDRIREVGVRFAPQPRVFRGEAPKDVLDRIAASLRVSFSDRSPV
jgi:hypothetical protein